ncbi:DUF3679 domain-containing protein [Mechercharimyces sp. CAU 1602]|uniref:DUF3679 domain-containing protein n=1 Tax=Mechercharimyces sp. CAU 1602 TaxID=2973933 RepID=UPI00216399D0|nr:DUF3679 domain-containing protein [Mechercharimyces sp. CAU 1602]MCS1350440.1 DUF3679 domain-containing protein [Mechercharimyces sp. CAU 1602]
MKYTGQVTLLLLVLLFGIFLGIDTAEDSIQEMQGQEGASQALEIRPEDGWVEIEVLGEEFTTEYPVDKINIRAVETLKQEASEATIGPSSNQLAIWGNQVGTGLEEGARTTLVKILSIFKKENQQEEEPAEYQPVSPFEPGER